MTSPTTPPTIRRGYASTSLGQVHYRELAGPPIGSTLDEECEALLLLHQTADSSTQFLELMAELAGQVRAIAADTPGYGDSDRIPAAAEPPSVADYARAMSELLTALDMKRVAVLGTHTGAAIALELAASKPELVNRLVLSGLPDYEASERSAKIAAAASSPPLDATGAHLHTAWERAAEPMWGRSDLTQITRSAVDSVRALPNRHYGPLAVFHFEGRPRIPLVNAPTLLLYGERDPFAIRQPTLATLFGNGRAEQMAGAGASPMQHRPAEFARRLTAFLGES